MRAAVALLALLLTACTAAPYATPRPAVALAIATDNTALMAEQRQAQASATAQRIAFSATETALSHSAILSITRLAVEVRQTAAALTATMQSIDGTQIALGRLSAQATATVAMWPTAAQATSEALYVAADQARVSARTTSLLSDLVFALCIIVGSAGAVWLIFSVGVWLATIAETHRHNRAMNRAVEDSQWAANARLWGEVKPEPEPDDTQESIRADRWRSRLRTFLAAGDARGFSNRKMCPAVLSNRNWGRITDWLISCGILAKDIDAKIGTRWADGMDLPRALEKLRSGAIPLPVWGPVEVTWAGNTPRSTRSETVGTLTEGELK